MAKENFLSLGAVRSTSDIGRQTGEKTKLLNSETGMTTWLFKAIYYDKFGRVLQTGSDNHLGGKDYVTNKYNFAGEIIQTRNRNIASATYTDTYFDLDHRGRLMKTLLKINGTGKVLMAGNNYNEAGNLAIQYLHSESGGAFLQKNDYTYNIRGWVTQLNNPGSFTENDKFGMKLEYNTVTSPAVAKYNGNIAGFTWGTPNLTNARYVYTYDNNNRLTNANYTATANTYALDETFTYDANGNMLTLGRYDYSGVQTDRIVFTYSGNRVTGLKDIAGDKAGVIDYPGVNNSLPYVYDYNGNVTNEPHKQLGIGYNMMNLPYLINWNGLNRKINYFYTFNGEKLRKTVENNGIITNVDYCGPFVYETTSGTRSLKYFATPFGRVVKNGSAWVYEYNLTDHLGNVRVVIKKGTNGLAEIIQQKGYYSFGMEISQFSAGTGTSKNWYNGKEIQDDYGLYWYDYGARFYDPMLGRWHTVDKLAEDPNQISQSPYQYAWNNPINLNDPDGNCPWCIIGAVVGAAVDYGTQVAVNYAIGNENPWTKNISGASIITSTIAGAATGGLASVARTGAITATRAVAGSMAVNAGESISKQLGKEGTVNTTQVVMDVAVSQIADGISTKNLVPTKQIESQLDRAIRIAGDNPRASRAEAVNIAQRKANTANNVNQAVSTAQAKATEKLIPNISGGATGSSSSYDSQVIIPAPWVVMPSDNTKVNLPIKR